MHLSLTQLGMILTKRIHYIMLRNKKVKTFQKYMLFIAKLCPTTIENGHLAENCERRIGNICSFTCNEKYISAIDPKNIICTTGEIWSSDTKRLCSRKLFLT